MSGLDRWLTLPRPPPPVFPDLSPLTLNSYLVTLFLDQIQTPATFQGKLCVTFGRIIQFEKEVGSSRIWIQAFTNPLLRQMMPGNSLPSLNISFLMYDRDIMPQSMLAAVTKIAWLTVIFLTYLHREQAFLLSIHKNFHTSLLLYIQNILRGFCLSFACVQIYCHLIFSCTKMHTFLLQTKLWLGWIYSLTICSSNVL